MQMSLSWRVGGLAALGPQHLGCFLCCGGGDPQQIVAFGDSLSDTGNLAARLATVGVISPADPYYQGRFSNGAIAVEVMADKLGVSLESYGYGGAKTGLDNRTTTTGALLNGTGVEGQINSYVTQENGALDPNALYVVWAAGNDFFDAPVGATVLSASQESGQGCEPALCGWCASVLRAHLA